MEQDILVQGKSRQAVVLLWMATKMLQHCRF